MAKVVKFSLNVSIQNLSYFVATTSVPGTQETFRPKISGGIVGYVSTQIIAVLRSAIMYLITTLSFFLPIVLLPDLGLTTKNLS